MKNLIQQKPLSRQESQDLFSNLGTHPPEHQAAILALMRAKHETTDEILGALDYFQSTTIPITHQLNILDIVGTGGDQLGTLNISTTASLLVSSTGTHVAKHGGKSASGGAGSQDVMLALNIPPSNPSSCLEQLHKNHFTYLFAPDYNSALKPYGPLRKKLGFPSIFNTLGPLLNPLRPQTILCGVYRYDLLEKVAQILQTRGVKRAMVVHGDCGLDEISICDATHAIEINESKLTHHCFRPEEFGFKRASIQQIQGSGAYENAALIEKILSGHLPGAATDCVLLNAGCALYLMGKTPSIEAGIELAHETIISGKAIHQLNQIRRSHAFFK